MEAIRFDLVTKSLASRLTRCTALKAAGAGVAGTAALAVGLRATTAQGGTATPTTGGALTNDAFLFVQDARSGTFAANPGAGTPAAGGTPTPGGGADYLLTLEGHTGNTVYFSDRPERIFGEAPTQQFLDGLGFSPNNPPNAAIVTETADGTSDTLIVELLDPVFDAGTGTIRYGANVLSDYNGTGLAHLAGQQRDESLPATLGNVSLFIDDCADLTGCYAVDDPDPQIYAGPIPDGLPTSMCWKWGDVACEPCNGDSRSFYDQACQDAYPECRSCYAS